MTSVVVSNKSGNERLVLLIRLLKRSAIFAGPEDYSDASGGNNILVSSLMEVLKISTDQEIEVVLVTLPLIILRLRWCEEKAWEYFKRETMPKRSPTAFM